jgi:hypothetical protein
MHFAENRRVFGVDRREAACDDDDSLVSARRPFRIDALGKSLTP